MIVTRGYGASQMIVTRGYGGTAIVEVVKREVLRLKSYISMVLRIDSSLR